MSNFKDIPDFFRQSQAVFKKIKDIPDFSVGNRKDPQMSIQGHPRFFSASAAIRKRTIFKDIPDLSCGKRRDRQMTPFFFPASAGIQKRKKSRTSIPDFFGNLRDGAPNLC